MAVNYPTFPNDVVLNSLSASAISGTNAQIGNNLIVSGTIRFVDDTVQATAYTGGAGGTIYNTNLTLAPVGVYDPNVVLIMHFSGSNNSTNITDSSFSEKTINVNGNAKISTTESKYGGSSLYLDGNGDYLTSPDNADFDLGNNDFTIEFWAFCTDQTNNYPSYIATDGTWGDGAFAYRFDNLGQSGKFSVHWHPDDPIVTTTNTFSNNTWTHTALVRNNNLLTLYVNGVNEASASINPVKTLDLSRGGNLYIGQSPWDGGNGFVNDYIDDLRITKGVALYTANFTPPTQQLTGGLEYISSSYAGTFNLTGNLNISGAVTASEGIKFGDGTIQTSIVTLQDAYNNTTASTTIELADTKDLEIFPAFGAYAGISLNSNAASNFEVTDNQLDLGTINSGDVNLNSAYNLTLTAVETLNINAGNPISGDIYLNSSNNIYLSNLTGTVQINNTITLLAQNTLPVGSLGMLATSGSNLYFHDGSSWRQVSLI